MPKGASAVTHKDGCTSPYGHGLGPNAEQKNVFHPNELYLCCMRGAERCLHPNGNCEHRSCKLPTLQGESQHPQPTRADAAMGTQCLLLYRNDQGETFFKYLCPNTDAG